MIGDYGRSSRTQFFHSSTDLSPPPWEIVGAKLRSSLLGTSLLTKLQLHSIHSASSDRSSLSSGSPDTSPLQHQIQPVQQVTPSISLSPAQTNSYVHGVAASHNHVNYQQQQQQQPQANRTRKVIPIVNPNTGMTMTSPPSSISPAMMQTAQRRW